MDDDPTDLRERADGAGHGGGDSSPASDGTFTSNNSADILSTSVPASRVTRRSGRYEIDGYVLRLKYADGTSISRSLVVSEEQLCISGDVHLPPS